LTSSNCKKCGNDSDSDDD